jgi:hypothetical protein
MDDKREEMLTAGELCKRSVWKRRRGKIGGERRKNSKEVDEAESRGRRRRPIEEGTH